MLAVAPSEGKSFEALVAALQERHAERLASKAFLPFFPAFPKRKTEIKVVTAGLIYDSDAAHGAAGERSKTGDSEVRLGLLATSNYELSAAAGARCAEQNALGLLIHYSVQPSAVRYIVDISHSVFAERMDKPVPLALGPCPICCDHLRGLIKGTPSLSSVRIFCGTPGLEAWMPTLGEQVGTVKRGDLTEAVAGDSANGGKRGAAADAAAGAAAEEPAFKRQALSSSGSGTSTKTSAS